MIRVRYLYSACVAIETPDLKIVCDPWFTDGVYDGAWHTFPKLADPLIAIGDVDAIYVSHIHPDHYDPVFLRAYFDRYGPKRIFIAPFKRNHLQRKMGADGFKPQIVEVLEQGATYVALTLDSAAESDGDHDIDSALVVEWRGPDRTHSVLNFNDCIFTQRLGEDVRAKMTVKPDIALLGYTGAGPYPQTYYDDPTTLADLAERKKQAFFTRYQTARDYFDPRVTIPFAGQYVLGGPLAPLNPYRGVADAVEVLAVCDRAIVLDDGGDAFIDTQTLKPSRVRTQPYAADLIAARITEAAQRPMAYDMIPKALADSAPIERLLRAACARASSKSVLGHDYYFIVNGRWALNAKRGAAGVEIVGPSGAGAFNPRSEIEVDPRHLFGLLTGLYHWNNAEVGSHFRTRRTPDVFDREAQRFLDFLAVI